MEGDTWVHVNYIRYLLGAYPEPGAGLRAMKDRNMKAGADLRELQSCWRYRTDLHKKKKAKEIGLST